MKLMTAALICLTSLSLSAQTPNGAPKLGAVPAATPPPPPVVSAPGAAAAPAADGACKDDREKLCPGMGLGEGLMKCMHAKTAQLSASCKAMIEKGKEKMQAGREACADDIEKHCKDVRPGKARIMRCLREHKAELTPECAAAFPRSKR